MAVWPKKRRPGMEFISRVFGKSENVPDLCETRDAVITNSKGETVFEQKNVIFPPGWSQMAVNIVASKYFHGQIGTENREYSFYQLADRIVDTITMWGQDGGYFKSEFDSEVFKSELRGLLVGQYVAFNSPVNFNLGAGRARPDAVTKNWHWNAISGEIQFGEVKGFERPQCSACFINSVQDSMESILELSKTEGMLFKWGSGTGTNLSPIRSSVEKLGGGGIASGPVSFMRGFDAFAGVIKSGGTTRRAAKMVILNTDHPDIEEFILCKGKEEAKAHALMREGYDGSSGPESEAYLSISFQNANNSVRVTDAFMKAATENLNDDWNLISVKTGDVVKTVSARRILRMIADQTWQCGDPGMQYDTTINTWHTCKTSGRINASNPCSEYMFLDDSACNLASFNLLKFYDRGEFQVDLFLAAVRIVTTAMDIIVDGAGYPTEEIAKNSHDYRPLGLGYANLGALLMEMGYPYDSEQGRYIAALITSIMGGQAYRTSAELAAKAQFIPAAHDDLVGGRVGHSFGDFPGYKSNRSPFLDVILKHAVAALNLSIGEVVAKEGALLRDRARNVWEEARSIGERAGFRNAQVTVLAPTGTIGFMMDCDTTGIEPMIGLVTFKKMVGGGFQKLAYPVVEKALTKLGYKNEGDILRYIEETGSIVGAPDVKEEHYPIFDCAFGPPGSRTISPLGHIKMMAAVQPFLSGAISKTVNMPEHATVEEIEQAYIQSWKLGLKAVAIYRDGSKKNQVLVTKKDDDKKDDVVVSGLVSHDALLPILEHVEPGELPEAVKDALLKLLGIDTDRKAIPVEDPNGPPSAKRHKLPDTRDALVHKFSIAGHEGYLHVGLYPSGDVGEIFITMAKEGSTLSGVMDSFATAVSIGLQHGVPLETLIDKFAHSRFEPSGWSHDGRIGFAKSIMDYLFRWLKLEFVDKPVLMPALVGETGPEEPLLGAAGEFIDNYVIGVAETPNPSDGAVAVDVKVRTEVHTAGDALAQVLNLGDSPSCSACGAIMVRNGSCYRCMECGGTSGCS